MPVSFGPRAQRAHGLNSMRSIPNRRFWYGGKMTMHARLFPSYETFSCGKQPWYPRGRPERTRADLGEEADHVVVRGGALSERVEVDCRGHSQCRPAMASPPEARTPVDVEEERLVVDEELAEQGQVLAVQLRARISVRRARPPREPAPSPSRRRSPR
jgi:hypothetical protein